MLHARRGAKRAHIDVSAVAYKKMDQSVRPAASVSMWAREAAGRLHAMAGWPALGLACHGSWVPCRRRRRPRRLGQAWPAMANWRARPARTCAVQRLRLTARRGWAGNLGWPLGKCDSGGEKHGHA